MTNSKRVMMVTCPEVSVVHDERDEGLEVTVDLPGVSKENVELTVSKGGFCVTASRDDLRYEGCFQFGHAVNGDEAQAKFDNGLLLLKVPFLEPLCGKRIAIE